MQMNELLQWLSDCHSGLHHTPKLQLNYNTSAMVAMENAPVRWCGATRNREQSEELLA